MVFHILLTECAHEELNSAWGSWVPRRRSNLWVLEKIHAFQHIGMCDTCVSLELPRTSWDLMYDTVTEKCGMSQWGRCGSIEILAKRGCVLASCYLNKLDVVKFELDFAGPGALVCVVTAGTSPNQTAVYRNLNHAQPRFLLKGRHLDQSQNNSLLFEVYSGPIGLKYRRARCDAERSRRGELA